MPETTLVILLLSILTPGTPFLLPNSCNLPGRAPCPLPGNTGMAPKNPEGVLLLYLPSLVIHCKNHPEKGHSYRIISQTHGASTLEGTSSLLSPSLLDAISRGWPAVPRGAPSSLPSASVSSFHPPGTPSAFQASPEAERFLSLWILLLSLFFLKHTAFLSPRC